jgi:DNA-binding NarL/FixJ family response regulator
MVLVAHPARAVAEALAARLAPDARVASATTLAEALGMLAACPHRLVLAASSLPADTLNRPVERDAGSTGRLVRALRDAPWAPDVALLGPTDEVRSGAAARAGARGWLTMDGSAVAFRAAVEALLRGELVLDRHTPGALPARRGVLPGGEHGDRDGDTDPALDAARRLARLSRREREVLRHLVAGLAPAAIAQALTVSPATARKHVERVRAKLGVCSAVEAVAVARRAPSAESGF